MKLPSARDWVMDAIDIQSEQRAVEFLNDVCNAALEAAAQVADEYQDEPWGEYKNWRASQVTSREIRDKILELKGAE